MSVFFLIVVTVAGYPELYDFTNHSYNDLNRNSEITEVLEISEKLFFIYLFGSVQFTVSKCQHLFSCCLATTIKKTQQICLDVFKKRAAKGLSLFQDAKHSHGQGLGSGLWISEDSMGLCNIWGKVVEGKTQRQKSATMADVYPLFISAVLVGELKEETIKLILGHCWFLPREEGGIRGSLAPAHLETVQWDYSTVHYECNALLNDHVKVDVTEGCYSVFGYFI